MIKNYLKTAWRNLVKNKIFSFINILGLSIAMAACMLILQYVSFQFSFDQFNKNVPGLYRVVNDRYQDGKLIQHGIITYSGISKAMQDDFPEVINHTRVIPMDGQIIIHGNEKFGDQRGFAVDNSFLSMFSYPVIAGDTKTALKEPNSLILSETLAKKIFKIRDNNFESVIGKELVMQWDSLPNKITAVCKDIPENSHLSFDFLWSYVSLYSGPNPWKDADHNFTSSDFFHYIQLKPGTDYQALQAKFPAFSQRHFQGKKVSGSDEVFYLQPLSKAHLYSDFEYEIGKTGNAKVVWGLLIIGVLIIVIAWVNYVNLTTAKSMERAKEVGVRKVSGATRRQLIKQFLSESLIINIIALCIALILVQLMQGIFNNLVKYDLSLLFIFQKGLTGYSIVLSLLAIILVGILMSAFYPAFMLSSFKPIHVLKGKLATSLKGVALRKTLVVGQFAITIALIIGSFVVYRQIRFISSQDLGFNMSQILTVKGPLLTDYDSTFIDRQYSFLGALKQIPGVEGSAFSTSVPGGEMSRNFDIYRSDGPAENKLTFRRNSISSEFINVYQMNLLAGRNFTQSDYHYRFAHKRNIILNESAVKLLGFASADEAIGKKMNRGPVVWDIVGVVADFHQKSLRYPMEPVWFLANSNTSSSFSIKVHPQNLQTTIAAIKKSYDAFFPGNLFDYSFVDERFNAQYAIDRLFGKVFTIFSGIAIFIACLGLLGLSLFATAQRTKEIGVRKVLGASVSGIVVMLSKDFIKLVLIALVIATPVAYLVMHRWLQDFAYRINISWWVFAIAGLVAIIIAFATISFQTIKAAVANPVKSLRTE